MIVEVVDLITWDVEYIDSVYWALRRMLKILFQILKGHLLTRVNLEVIIKMVLLLSVKFGLDESYYFR